jgi:hypothetical protein
VRRGGDVVDLLLQVGHLGLAHRLVELVLELIGHAAQLRHPLPERAQHGGQLLRPDEYQRHHADEQKLAPADVEHGRLRARLRKLAQSAQCCRRRPAE